MILQQKEDDEEEAEYDTFFSDKDKILLCDLGGGTADIACHEVDGDGHIRQIVAPSGGAWGSTYVDANFIDLLRSMLSAEWMKQFERQHPTAFVELLLNFRSRYFGHAMTKRVRGRVFNEFLKGYLKMLRIQDIFEIPLENA